MLQRQTHFYICCTGRCNESYLKFLLCFLESLGVSTVNHIYEDVCVVEVVSPVRSDLPLATNVPDIELESLALDWLDVEALGWSDGGDVFTGQTLENGRLPCIVQTKQQYPQFLVRRWLQFPATYFLESSNFVEIFLSHLRMLRRPMLVIRKMKGEVTTTPSLQINIKVA